MTKRACNTISQKTRFELMKFLESVVKKDPDHPDFVAFIDGWNDNKISEKFSVNISRVRAIRQELFGELRRGGGNGHSLPAVRLVELEKRVAELERRLRVSDFQYAANGAHADHAR